jgi:tetratricopeptide (TPR) repeat protein
VLRLVPVNILNELRSTYFFGKGKAKLRRGDSNQALGCFEKMLQYAEKSGDEAAKALAYRSVAEVFLEARNYPKARIFAEKGREIFLNLEKDSPHYRQPREEMERLLRTLKKAGKQK